MNRRQLLAAAGLAACPAILRASAVRRVLIIGAGAAGLAAARQLVRAGLQVQILEARATWGGRMAQRLDFADFPIDIGAEWIHGSPKLLQKIAGQDTSIVQTIDYRPKTYQQWFKDRLRDLPTQDYRETKFRSTTWVSFFDTYFRRELGGMIGYNAVLRALEMDGQTVTGRLADGRSLDADRVLLTVPLSVLQRGDIRLPRPLPRDLQRVTFGQGFKLFLKFKERFYPDILITGPLSQFIADDWDEKTYYDAAFGKQSADHVLGLFTASMAALPRAALSDRAILAEALAELDLIYAGAASRLFLDGHVQNWTRAPHIWGSYSMENQADQTIKDMLRPIDNKIFFAGEALGGADQATVHGAAFSGMRAARRIIES